MITRSNLVEQLREYQIRSKHDWASVSFFSSTSSNITTSRYALPPPLFAMFIVCLTIIVHMGLKDHKFRSANFEFFYFLTSNVFFPTGFGLFPVTIFCFCFLN